ncbi:hypothetical protein NKG05_18535 [Oerskovia sp. M15]
MARTSAPGAPHGAAPGTPRARPRPALRSRRACAKGTAGGTAGRALSAVTSLAVAGFLLVVGTLTLLADRGFSIVHQCLPAPGLGRRRGPPGAPAGECGVPCRDRGPRWRSRPCGHRRRRPRAARPAGPPRAPARRLGLAAVALRVHDRVVGVLRPAGSPPCSAARSPRSRAPAVRSSCRRPRSSATSPSRRCGRCADLRRRSRPPDDPSP